MASLKAKICPICEKSANLTCKACENISYCSFEHQKEHWKQHKSQCRTVTLQVNDELNRYFVASRKLKAGTIILDELPIIFGPWVSPDTFSSCNNNMPTKDYMFCVSCCKQITYKPYPCTKCKWPFCNASCAKIKAHTLNECKHFRLHKVKFSSSKLSPFLLYRGVLILRGLLLKSAPYSEDPVKWNSLVNLQHKRSIGISPYNLTLEDISQIKTFFSAPEVWCDEDWVKVNGLIDVNAFSLTRAEDENPENSPSEVTAVFLNASIFAHSCSPNATWGVGYSPKFSIRIRASNTINKGEMISISYNHSWTHFGTIKRKQMILDMAGFICKCKRCLDFTELGTCMEGVKCDKCQNYMLPQENQVNLNFNWRCLSPKCPRSTDTKNDLEILSKVNTIEAEWKEINKTWTSIPVVGWMLVQKFITNYSKNMLHPNHWIIQQASRSIIMTLGSCLKKMERNMLETFIQNCDYLFKIANILTPGVSLDRGLLELYLSRALFIKYNNFIKSGENSKSQMGLLKRIHELQKDALIFWTLDIQSRPLNKEMGYEASCLHDETLLVLTCMTSESQPQSKAHKD